MSGYRWTLRVAVGGCGLLGLLVAAIALVRIFGIVIAGVEPEAWVLTAMMTAPFAVGSVSLATLATLLVEASVRRRGGVCA